MKVRAQFGDATVDDALLEAYHELVHVNNSKKAGGENDSNESRADNKADDSIETV